MKSMIAFIGLLALVAVYADHHDEPKKVCFQGSDSTCDNLKENVKTMIKSIRETRTGELQDDIPTFLGHLRDLFEVTAKYNCRMEICKCGDSEELKCHFITDAIREPLSKLKLPACLDQSEKAKGFMEKFQKAIVDGDRQMIADTIGELQTVVAAALTEDPVKAECLKQTVMGIKTAVKGKMAHFDVQKDCTFCKLPSVGPSLLANN